MNAFIDTNIPVAYSFEINSLNRKSIKIFEEYSKVFWSDTVKNEFNNVFIKKMTNLINFFESLLDCLEDKKHEIFEFGLYDYIRITDISKVYEDSFINFWNIYLDNSFPPVIDVINALNNFLLYLKSSPYLNKKFLSENVILTPSRIKDYSVLLKKLKYMGVHFPDYEIILDAYDFNVNYCPNLDFITFDNQCYGALFKIQEFQFHNIKGRYDFF